MYEESDQRNYKVPLWYHVICFNPVKAIYQ
jgi:hypothetical protein